MDSGSLLGLVPAAFGAGLLLLAASRAHRSQERLRTCARVPGTVVDVVPPGSPRSRAKGPVVEYVFDGRRRTYRSTFGTNPPAWKPGDDVTLLVRPDAPDDATIDSFLTLWLFPSLCAAFGALAAWIGLRIVFPG